MRKTLARLIMSEPWGNTLVGNEKRVDLFDRWAEDYDPSVVPAGDFPFAGYDEVLNATVQKATVKPEMRVLELGIGTGNLAERFVKAECDVWGIDFSARMLEKARQKLPYVRLVQADLVGELPEELPTGFDRIVSAYVLHEFDLVVKVRILVRMTREYLAEDGLVVVGDIAFPTVQDRERARQRWKAVWDEDEDYWAADEAIDALEKAALRVEYKQISICAGVMVISPAG